MEAFVVGGFVAVVLLLAFAGFVLWLWTLVDVIKVSSDEEFRAGNQLIWVIVIVFTQIVGSIIYLIVGRPDRPRDIRATTSAETSERDGSPDPAEDGAGGEN